MEFHENTQLGYDVSLQDILGKCSTCQNWKTVDKFHIPDKEKTFKSCNDCRSRSKTSYSGKQVKEIASMKTCECGRKVRPQQWEFHCNTLHHRFYQKCQELAKVSNINTC